jgi:hypothetical protein
MKHIRLDEEKTLENADKEHIEDFLVRYVNKLVADAEGDFYCALQDLDSDMNLDPRLKQPLIRVRVEYSSDHTSINAQRFGQHFVGKVANSSEIIKFQRKSNRKNTSLGNHRSAREEFNGKSDVLDELSVLGLIRKSLDASSSMFILPITDLNSALEQFVSKSEASAIPEFVESYLAKVKVGT